MRKKIKPFIIILSFFLAFSGVFYCVNTTLKFKYADGILPMEDLYSYPDESVDVLFLGSSHVGVNVDTVKLCNDYGIAAYNLWGAVQPTWNSYYYLKEALKTQKPKVVVMETFLVSQDYEYMDYSRIIKNTMGMKPSANKFNAVLTSATPDLFKDVLFGFSTYHSRYSSLEDEDFEHYAWNNKISDKNIDNGDYITPCKEPVIVSENQKKELSEKMGQYFEKIIELCKEQEIPLLLYTSPYSASQGEQERYNEVASIAEENDIPYINYNNCYKDIEIDFASDYCDSAGHFNNTGVGKMTDALGSYLKKHYKLSDRSKDTWFNMHPKTEAAFMIYEPFVGNGKDAYIDTEQMLFDDPKSTFTILTQIKTKTSKDGQVFFSCFSESQPYRGLLVRRDGDKLKVIVGNNYYFETQIESETETLAIVKDGNSYSVYVNQKAIGENVVSESESYKGNLLLGCQEGEDGEKQRFSEVTINQFELYQNAMKKQDVLSWMEANATRLTKEEMEEQLRKNHSEDIQYSLEEPFEGDGEKEYIDTKKQLFYDASKDFTFLMEFNSNTYGDNGVFAGCFSEEENKYRGLLVRQDDNALHVIVGNNYYVEITPARDSLEKLAIVKEGSSYDIYLNGISVAENIESPCDSYLGTLMIGAQNTEDYDVFRISKVSINRLEVKDKCLSQEEIQKW